MVAGKRVNELVFDEALLAHFKTIENLVCAREHELEDVAGVGKKRAHEIKRLLSTDYEQA